MVDETQTTSLKTCSSCGQRKPLTAFRQLSGTRTIVYGNICSACRQIQSRIKITPDEDASTSATGLTLGIKEKLQREQDIRELNEENKNKEKKERGEKLEASLKREENKVNIAENEKKHRQLKLSSFLDSTNAISKKITNNTTTTNRFLTDHFAAEERRVVDQGVVEDKAQREIDTTSPQSLLDVGTDKQKFKTALFQNFLRSMPKGAAIVKNVEQLLKIYPNEDPRPTGPKKKS